MSGLEIGILVAAIVAVCGVGAGVTFQLAGASRAGLFYAGMLWPVFLPAVLGARLARWHKRRGADRDFPSAKVRK